MPIPAHPKTPVQISPSAAAEALKKWMAGEDLGLNEERFIAELSHRNQVEQLASVYGARS